MPLNISSSTLLYVEESLTTQSVLPTEISFDTLSNMVADFEGFSDTLYYCQGGKPTIGYGTLVYDTINFRTITKPKAKQYLSSHLKGFEQSFYKIIGKDIYKFNKWHKEALISLIYNIGVNRFKRSNLCRLVKDNPYDYANIEREFKEFRKAGCKISKGLVERRAKEWEHYIKGGGNEVRCYTVRKYIY